MLSYRGMHTFALRGKGESALNAAMGIDVTRNWENGVKNVDCYNPFLVIYF